MMFLLLTLALLSFTNAQLLGDLLNLDFSLVGGARSQLAGALTADGQVFFAGGVGNNLLTSLSAAVDVVATVDTTVVTAGKSLSASRYGLSAATAANFSIFAGGLAASGAASADVDVYDATTGTWNTTTLAVARGHHCVGSTADYLYVAGGQVSTGVYTESVEVFVAATGEIDASLNFTLSLARAYVATATLDSTVFFAGGLYVNGTTAEVATAVDVYDSVNANLTTVDLSEGRQQIAAIAVGTQVFFAGGASATGVASAVVDIWHSANASFTTTQLSVARWGVRAVVVGDFVLFHGGYTAANTASAVIDVYNFVNQTWEVPQALKRARADFASVAVDNKVYIAGGVSAGLAALITGSGSLEVLDFSPSNNTDIPTPTPTESANLTVTVVTFGTARAQLAATVSASGQLLIGGGAGLSVAFNAITAIDVANPVDVTTDLTQVLGVARLGLSAATVANVSVFAGGASFGLVPSTQVDIYFANNETWDSAALQTARVFHATAIVGSKIYFAGGRGTLAFQSSIEVYDTETGSWETLSATLSVARGYLSASVVGNYIIFAGGRTGLIATGTVSNAVDVLDTTTNTIVFTGLSLSVARAELAASVSGDLVLFGGGVVASGQATDVIDIWNSTSGEFVAGVTVTLSAARWGLQAVTVGTEVLFVGGFDGTTTFGTVDIYNSVDGQITVKELTFPRYNFAATVDVDSNVYFCGGRDSLGFLASVEIYAGASSDNTPTPTPGEETPTPTPVVVPTPTPGQTPTPTPGVNDCVQLCQDRFDSDSSSFNLGVTFTVQCSVWATRLTCLDACKTAGTDTTGAHDAAVTSCQQAPNIQDFCACERDNFGFNVDATLAFIDTNNGQFVTDFNGLTGVVTSPANGVAGTVITVNKDAKTLGVTFVYDDSVIIGTVQATVDLIGVEWSVQLADYFNTSPLNFAASSSKKRTEQQGSLTVAVADNAGSSGVSQISISFAFVLVTFLLHILF